MAPLDQDMDPDSDEAEFVESRLKGRNPLAVAHWLTAFGMPTQLFIAQKAFNKLGLLRLAGLRFAFHIAHVGDRVPKNLIRRRGLTICPRDKSDRNIQVWVNGVDVKGKIGTSIRIVLREVMHAAMLGVVRLENLKSPLETKPDNDVQGLHEVADAVIKQFNARVSAFKNGGVELAAFETEMHQSTDSAFTNADAALAWILSSPYAYDYLQAIPYEGRTLWARLVEVVRTALDLSPDTEPWVSRMLRVSEDFPENTPDETMKVEDENGIPMAIQTPLRNR